MKQENKNAIETLFKEIYQSKIGKTVIIIGGVALVIGLSGLAFKLLSFSVGNFQKLSKTIRGE
jgi:hypothetical protein